MKVHLQGACVLFPLHAYNKSIHSTRRLQMYRELSATDLFLDFRKELLIRLRVTDAIKIAHMLL